MANELDEAWEEELNNPGAMALYENWVRLEISLIMMCLLFVKTLNIFSCSSIAVVVAVLKITLSTSECHHKHASKTKIWRTRIISFSRAAVYYLRAIGWVS